jgi:type II secretory pathway component GspD/PulD (secretin)
MGGSMSGGSSAGYSGGAVSSGASSSTGGVSTISMSGSPSAGGVGTSSTNTGRESREVILSGDEALVDQAYALAEQLDRRRKQVKIDVNITDVSLDNLKNLGIQWSFPQFGVHEGTPSGFSFGSFKRDPLNFEATMSALMDQNKAKLLAAPSIALLDGEQGYILIGQRVSYPLLTGYTQAQTPIFSVGQEEVGIYLQVKAQMTGEDEIMLSVYPQVSFITGYLNVNGASYPQVSTREQQTTIRVESGGKVVIGGLINDEDIRDEQNVPILSKIPFFGELFKYRNTHKTRDEVIMTITPQIISD